MRTAAIASITLLSLIGLAAGPGDADRADQAAPAAAAPQRADDEAAVREVFKSMTAAWAKGDAAAFAALFSAQARFVNIVGKTLSGREEIERHHAELFAGPYQGTSAVIAADSVRFLRPDVAIASVTGALLPAGMKPEQLDPKSRAQFIVTCTLARGDKGWMIEAFHNTVREPAVAPPPTKP